MFESLTNKLGGVLAGLSKKGRLSEQDIDEALRAVRLALLEADVDFKVVRDFVKSIKAKAAKRSSSHANRCLILMSLFVLTHYLNISRTKPRTAITFAFNSQHVRHF